MLRATLLVVLALVALVHSQTATAVCSAWGDPHFTTADGVVYTNMTHGNWYLFGGKGIASYGFSKLGCNGAVATCIYNFTTVVQDYGIMMDVNNNIQYTVGPTYNDSTSYVDITSQVSATPMTINPYTTVATLNGGLVLEITTNQGQLLEIQINGFTISYTYDSSWSKSTWGLCGYYDGSQDTEYLSSFCEFTDVGTFVESWEVTPDLPVEYVKKFDPECTKKLSPPTVAPTAAPTVPPTVPPTATPTPTVPPTVAPTKGPTSAPTKAPTAAPTTPPISSSSEACPINYLNEQEKTAATEACTNAGFTEPTYTELLCQCQQNFTEDKNIDYSDDWSESFYCQGLNGTYLNETVKEDALRKCANAVGSLSAYQYCTCLYDYTITQDQSFVGDSGYSYYVTCAASSSSASTDCNAYFNCPDSCNFNGKCVSGTCQCNDGYSGSSCSTKGLTKAGKIAVITVGAIVGIVIGVVAFVALSGYGGVKGYQYLKNHRISSSHSNPLYNEKPSNDNPFYANK